MKIDIKVLLSDEIPSNSKIHCTLDNDSRLGEHCGLLSLVNETVTCRLVQCEQIRPYVCYQYQESTAIKELQKDLTTESLGDTVTRDQPSQQTEIGTSNTKLLGK